MSETPEHQTERTAATHSSTATLPPPPPPHAPAHDDGRPNRLAVIALWVAIVAGVVFTIAVIFFSGFALGRHAGGGGYHHMQRGHDRQSGMIFRHPGPRMGPMGPMGPGGPFQQGPGGPGSQSPQTPSPTVTPAPPTPRP